MRTSFELKIIAASLEEAKQTAIEEIAAFLRIKQVDKMDFVVTVFGSVKQSVVKPF